MSKLFSRDDINNMGQRYRANFINSLSGFKSANLVGSVDDNGNENLAVISSVVHLGANPPLLGMVMRPHTVRRDTLENIQNSGLYTINHIGGSFTQQAHQTSARYDQDESEFAATGLTSEYQDDFACPYVKESPIKLGLKLVEIIPITHNDTLFVIGEVQQVLTPESIVSEDGFVSLDKANVVCINGLDGYAVPSSTVRYSYAKKGTELEEITP